MKQLILLPLALGMAHSSQGNSKNENHIINGQFQRPRISGDWRHFRHGIEGWKGNTVQIARGRYLNHRWRKRNQVCQLDTYQNSQITQIIKTSHPLMKLSLDYAARDHFALQTSQMDIIWNGQVLQLVQPQNYDVNHIEIDVYTKTGQNTLSFRGKGPSDHFGISIDNVQLVPTSNGKPETASQGNLVDGNLNRVKGSHNELIGNNNGIKGDQNIVDGNNNNIDSDGNFVWGGGNFVS